MIKIIYLILLKKDADLGVWEILILNQRQKFDPFEYLFIYEDKFLNVI